jgi:hypothetical protein
MKGEGGNSVIIKGEGGRSVIIKQKGGRLVICCPCRRSISGCHIRLLYSTLGLAKFVNSGSLSMKKRTRSGQRGGGSYD